MIRFLTLKYYFTSNVTYATQHLYTKKNRTRVSSSYFIIKNYLLHISFLRLYYRQQICYKTEVQFLVKRFGATHKLTGYLMRRGLVRL